VMGIHVHRSARFLPVRPSLLFDSVHKLSKIWVSHCDAIFENPLRSRNVDQRSEMPEHSGVQRSRSISAEVRFVSEEC
ncbi:hypothetical protein PENTCL1PPCAC_9133, partial [Pristionchus entomophagus]